MDPANGSCTQMLPLSSIHHTDPKVKKNQNGKNRGEKNELWSSHAEPSAARRRPSLSPATLRCSSGGELVYLKDLRWSPTESPVLRQARFNLQSISIASNWLTIGCDNWSEGNSSKYFFPLSIRKELEYTLINRWISYINILFLSRCNLKFPYQNFLMPHSVT